MRSVRDEKHKDRDYLQHLSKEANREGDLASEMRATMDVKHLHDKNPVRGKHCQMDQRLKQLGQPKKGGEGGWGSDKDAIRQGLEDQTDIAFDENDPLAPDVETRC